MGKEKINKINVALLKLMCIFEVTKRNKHENIIHLSRNHNGGISFSHCSSGNNRSNRDSKRKLSRNNSIVIMRTPTNDHYVALLKKVMPQPKRDNGTQAGIDALRKSLERSAKK